MALNHEILDHEMFNLKTNSNGKLNYCVHFHQMYSQFGIHNGKEEYRWITYATFTSRIKGWSTYVGVAILHPTDQRAGVDDFTKGCWIAFKDAVRKMSLGQGFDAVLTEILVKKFSKALYRAIMQERNKGNE